MATVPPTSLMGSPAGSAADLGALAVVICPLSGFGVVFSLPNL